MSDLSLKEKQAVQYLRDFAGDGEPYYLCYSGGKDSDTIRILAELAGVKFEVHNNHTTVDAPETVRYIRDVVAGYGDRGFIHQPARTMWQLIVDKGFPPTRLARYCCAELKERGGAGRRKITGVRWAESANRKNNQGLITVIGKPKTTLKAIDEIGANFTLTNRGGVVLNTDNEETRRVIEMCYRTTSTLINPIIDWTDRDVWTFLKAHGCDSNPLYKCGKKRVGCIGCPLAGGKTQKKDFANYPAYRKNYVLAFDRMLKRLNDIGVKTYDYENGKYWADGEAVMRWWVGDNPLQMTVNDYLDYLDREADTMAEYI